jgi:hypothetical protein
MRRVLDATRAASEIVLLLQQYYTDVILLVVSRSVPEHSSASTGLAAFLRAVEDTTLVVLRKCVDAFFAQVGAGRQAGATGGTCCVEPLCSCQLKGGAAGLCLHAACCSCPSCGAQLPRRCPGTGSRQQAAAALWPAAAHTACCPNCRTIN